MHRSGAMVARTQQTASCGFSPFLPHLTASANAFPNNGSDPPESAAEAVGIQMKSSFGLGHVRTLCQPSTELGAGLTAENAFKPSRRHRPEPQLSALNGTRRGSDGRSRFQTQPQTSSGTGTESRASQAHKKCGRAYLFRINQPVARTATDRISFKGCNPRPPRAKTPAQTSTCNRRNPCFGGSCRRTQAESVRRQARSGFPASGLPCDTLLSCSLPLFLLYRNRRIFCVGVLTNSSFSSTTSEMRENRLTLAFT